MWGGCGGEDRTRAIDGFAVLAPPKVDFGKVGLGTTATQKVLVRNESRAPVRILGWELEGLGDDLALALRGARSVKEGDQTEVVLRFTPREVGAIARTLVLHTDDPRNTKVKIPLSGEGILPFVTPVPDLLDFGRVEVGVRETLALELQNTFDIPLEVRIGVRGDDQFALEGEAAVRVEPLSSREIQVSFEPERVGRVVGTLALLPCPACSETLVLLVGAGIDQALQVAPPVVDFGFVPVERSAERNFTVTNVSSREVEITAMELGGTSDRFTLVPVLGTLAPDESLQVTVGFSPTVLRPDEEVVRIHSTSVRAPIVEVGLRGAGGGPQIQVSPSSLAFGMVPIGARGQIAVRITNAGTPPGAPPLEILDIRVENPIVSPFGVDRDLAADPVILDSGQVDEVMIGYEPTGTTASTPDEAELVIVSNDASLPEIRIPMNGHSMEVPPCERLEVEPALLDFGALDEGRGATLSVRIYNPGPDTCIMRNLRIAEGSDPAFRTTEVESFLIPGDQWFGWMVSFDPGAVGAGEGDYRGEFELFAVNATVQQRYSVALRASSDSGCLRAEPNFLDFGGERSDCGFRVGSVRFTNVCPLPLGVGPIELGAGSSEGEFEIVSAPATPMDLASGASFEVRIRWNTVSRGLSTAPLYVMEDTRLRPLMVPILGELQRDGRRVDRFIQHREDAADILLVVDNSSTMSEEQPRLAQASRILIDEAEARGVDFHIGVTSTGITPAPAGGCPGGADGGEAGRLAPVDESRPRVLTPATPDARGVLAASSQVGICHELEQGMEAMRRALSEPLRSGENAGFLRNDAKLAVIFVSDEDDHSGFAPDDYLAFLLALKGEGGAQVHGIVDIGSGCLEGAGRADRIIDLAQKTGGVVAPLCPVDWSPAMAAIAEEIFGFRTAFSLSATPNEEGVVVVVGGVEADPSTYRYDPASNSVSFAPGQTPAAGTSIEIRYTAACGG